jgi:hypothetical protein
VKEETIKKKTRQGLTALGAIVALVVGVLLWDGSGDDLQGLITGLVVLGLYFVPTVIAVVRKHRQIAPIILINLLLGWTVIGWIAALIWSVASFNREALSSQEK